MARKITMNRQSRKPIAEVFEDFVLSQTAQGFSNGFLQNKEGVVSSDVLRQLLL